MRRLPLFALALSDTFISLHPFSSFSFVHFHSALFSLAILSLFLPWPGSPFLLIFLGHTGVCMVVIVRVVDSVPGRVSADEVEVN